MPPKAATKARSLHELIRILHSFSELDNKMQVSTILVLLEIAAAETRGETVSVQDVEKTVGLLSGTSTRNVHYWAEGHQDVRGSHRMVAITTDSVDRRRRNLQLTSKGRAFLEAMWGET